MRISLYPIDCPESFLHIYFGIYKDLILNIEDFFLCNAYAGILFLKYHSDGPGDLINGL